MTISLAATQGWTALRDVFRVWGISAPEDLTEWMGREGFPRCAAGNHTSARAQEHILSSACAVDGRVALLEAVYFSIAIVAGRQMAPPESRFPVLARRRPVRSSGSVQDESWAQLDNIECKRCSDSVFPC